jgi:hypothetical protein
LRRVLLGSLVISAIILVPALAFRVAPSASNGGLSITSVAAVAAVGLTLFFALILRFSSAKIGAVVRFALVGAAIIAFLSLLVEDAAHEQYRQSSDVEVLRRVLRSAFSLSGALNVLACFALVFLPLLLAYFVVSIRKPAHLGEPGRRK